eukprot:416743_1
MSRLWLILTLFICTLALYECMECFDDDETCKAKTKKKITTITVDVAAPGRDKRAFDITDKHAVNGNKMLAPFPSNLKYAMFGMGCFWSSEKIFYKLKGVYSTQVGYIGGYTTHPIYEEVKDNLTGHIEVVRIIFNDEIISYSELLQLFWESHNPCQGMRQGIDWGTQYRSAIFYYNHMQKTIAIQTKNKYQILINSEYEDKMITTEISNANEHEFYYAEDYHQQYFYKHPEKAADCSMKGLGVTCPMPVFKELFSDNSQKNEL